MGGNIVDDDVATTEQGVPATSEEVLHVDHLFKRERSEHKKGILKVKFLGNALKDYQLIRLASDGPVPSDGDSLSSSTLNKPSFMFFMRARAAMGEP